MWVNNQHDLIKHINMTWLNNYSWFNKINEYGLIKKLIMI